MKTQIQRKNIAMMEIVDLTRKLVQFKTMHSKPGEIRQCVGYIQHYLKKLGVFFKRFDYGNTPALLALPDGEKTPVLLMSHLDVVDAPDRLFNPVIQDGKLYGRGCLDDKYAVALSLILLKNNFHRLENQGKTQKNLPFGILITSDEEIGGFNGAKKLLSEIQTDFCIVLDGGSVEKIVVKEKGVAGVRLLYRGKRDFSGEHRIERDALETVKNDIARWKTHFVTSAPVHRHRKVICNAIQSIPSYEEVPEIVEAQLEIHYTESDDLERMFTIMQRDLNSDIIIDHVSPRFDGGESKHLKRLLTISKKTRIGFEDGANDSRFLPGFGIKGIVWGADGNRSQHTMDEHVDIESIYELYGFLDTFVRQCESLGEIGTW